MREGKHKRAFNIHFTHQNKKIKAMHSNIYTSPSQYLKTQIVDFCSGGSETIHTQKMVQSVCYSVFSDTTTGSRQSGNISNSTHCCF